MIAATVAIVAMAVGLAKPASAAGGGLNDDPAAAFVTADGPEAVSAWDGGSAVVSIQPDHPGPIWLVEPDVVSIQPDHAGPIWLVEHPVPL